MSDKNTGAGDNKAEVEPGSTKATGSQRATERAEPAASASGGGAGMALFATLLSVIALGAAAFTWYQVKFTQQQNTSDVIIGLTEIGGRIEQFGRELDRVTAEQQGFMPREVLELTIEQNINALSRRQDDLEASVGKLNSSLERGVDAWAAEEVEQMLNIAVQAFALSGDSASAVSALQLADSSLESIRDPRYTAVRQAIARDIGELEALDQPDIPGIAAELNVLADAVSGLPLINEPEGEVLDEPIVAIDETAESSWRQELGELANDLVGLVRIQKVEESPRPLLAPQQRYFLEQNLRLMLYGAQLALLQGEAEVFSANLLQARAWVEDYFDAGKPRTKNYLADLNRVGNTRFDYEVPDISGSLRAFRQVKQQDIGE